MLSFSNSELINVVNNNFIDKLVSIENQHRSCQRLNGNIAHIRILASITNY